MPPGREGEDDRDAYLAVAAEMASKEQDSEAAICFSRDLVRELRRIEEESGIPLQVRIGIHTGPVVGGVIGSSRLASDYWGDTMNIASRLQAVAPANGIAVPEAAYFQTKSMQAFSPPETILLKGIGEFTPQNRNEALVESSMEWNGRRERIRDWNKLSPTTLGSGFWRIAEPLWPLNCYGPVRAQRGTCEGSAAPAYRRKVC